MAVLVISSKNFGEALERVRTEHEPGRWLYRGQLHRRPTHRLVAEGRPLELENLYPGSFRFASEHPTITPEFENRSNEEYQKAKGLFHVFNLFLISKYERAQGTDTRFAWMAPYYQELQELFTHPGPSLFSGFHAMGMGLQNPEFIRLSWSLAQHYGVVTALLDFTSSPTVAAWFASHPWSGSGGAQRVEGTGVLYRVETANIVAATIAFSQIFLATEQTNPFGPSVDRIFAQDLKCVPAKFALRPSRQEAAVIAGFDDLRFVKMISQSDALTAFVFEHAEDETSRWPLEVTREYLIPSDDPFDDLKDEFMSKWARLAPRWSQLKITKPVAVLTPQGTKYAVPGPAPPPPVDSQSYAKELLKKAENLGNRGRIDEAIALYDEPLTRFGTTAEPALRELIAVALLKKGLTLSHAGRGVESITVYDELLSRFGTASEPPIRQLVIKALDSKATTLGGLGRAREALGTFDEIIARIGLNCELPLRELLARTLLGKGVALAQLGRSEEAIAANEDIVARFGTASELPLRELVGTALIHKALTLALVGRREEAIAACDELLTRFGNPRELPLRELVAKAFFKKGFELAQAGKAEEAIAVYDDALAHFDMSDTTTLRQIAQEMRKLKSAIRSAHKPQ